MDTLSDATWLSGRCLASSVRKLLGPAGILAAMSQSSGKKRNLSGGSAATGGINYQAAVTAIAFVHMARGLPLGWIDSDTDIPTSVSAEEGSVGDDIKVVTASGDVLQVQVKKGISAGEKLWTELLSLASATLENSRLWAILVVDPQSSGVVRSDLAIAVRRIGDGRTDDLTQAGNKFLEKLDARGLPRSACARLRIKTLNALTDDSAHVDLAKSELDRLGVSRQDGWNTLYIEAGKLIEYRGRRTTISFTRLLLPSHQVTQTSPLASANRLLKAALSASSKLSIFGIPQPLDWEEAWLRQEVDPWSRSETAQGNLAEALTHYHADPSRNTGTSLDANGLGWFKRHCVVLGGPGMGKSTLLRRLRATYAHKSEVALFVSLRELSKRMRINGSTFEESLLALALDSTGVSPSEVRALGLQNLTWLLDGLDECGNYIESVAESIRQFADANAGVRVIVTTRPIGYDTSRLEDWKHYRLRPPSSIAANNVTTLIQSVTSVSQAERDAAAAFAREQLSSDAIKALAARSPMLASLIASLAFSRLAAGPSEASFYEAVLGLVHRVPTPRRPDGLPKVTLDAVVCRLGWVLLERPDSDCASALGICTEHMQLALGGSTLNAQSICEQALLYWEAVGVLERVHYQGLEAYTFVHKTFAEFAAAKALTNLDAPNRQMALQEILRKSEWRKVLDFAWDLGLSHELLDIVLDELRSDAGALGVVLQLIERGEVSMSNEAGLKLLDAVWAYIGSSPERSAYTLGHAMVSAAEYLPDEVRSSLERLGHTSMPVGLVAWTVHATRSPGNLEFERFLTFYDEYVAYQRTQPRLYGGIDLGDRLQGLLRRLLSAILGELARRGINEQAENFAARVRAGVPGFAFVSMDDMFAEAGWPGFRIKTARDYLTDYFSPEKNAQRRLQKVELLQLICAAAPATEGTGSIAKPWIHLSGFLSATQYRQIDSDELLDQEKWNQSLLHVIQATISAAGLDKERLGQEASQLLKELSITESDPFGFYDGLLEVDIDLDWSVEERISLDALLLEKAICHPCLWIGYMAGNLLHECVKGDELRKAVGRLLEHGGHSTLEIVAALAPSLGADHARKLIEDSLAVKLKDGCRHLFDALTKLPSPSSWSERTAAFFEGGFKFGPYTASAASEAATAYIPLARTRMEQLLKDAYQYWLANPPKASSPNVVPQSPRVDILRTLLICGPQPDIVNEALTYSRSDVRELATNAAMDMMRSDGALRARFVQQVADEMLGTSLLRTALTMRTPFDAAEVAHLIPCLQSSNPKMRFAAMGLLNTMYLTHQQIAAFLQQLADDPVAEIREQALSLKNGRTQIQVP